MALFCDGGSDKPSDSLMELSGCEMKRVQWHTVVIMVLKLQIS
jgi:hypothetical protein